MPPLERALRAMAHLNTGAPLVLIVPAIKRCGVPS